MGIEKHLIHIFLSTFCFINVTGNMVMAIVTDTSAKSNDTDGIYCEYCKRNRPPRSWHCKSCNICVLKRDHHCFFFSRCIGLHNQRYYLLFIVYILISMVYSTYYNYYYVSSKFEDYGFILSICRIINPLLRCMIPEPMAGRDLYVLFLFLNASLIIWMSILFWFHIKNVVRGVTAHESKDIGVIGNREWRENMLRVFGRRWYLAIVWPFLDSPLPEYDSVKTD
ncbi:putative palmitoyltransferase ZDHHC24 [Aphomia sociella]